MKRLLKIYVNRDRFTKRFTSIGAEWDFDWVGNGYMTIGIYGCVFLYSFVTWGVDFLGTQKEFFFRNQMTWDREPKISWFSFEAINPYEARLFYIWIKCWRSLNIKWVINFGPRLTKSSRDHLEKGVIEKLKLRQRELQKNAEQMKEGGSPHAAIR